MANQCSPTIQGMNVHLTCAALSCVPSFSAHYSNFTVCCRYLSAACNDHVRVYSVKTGLLVHTLRRHEADVSGIRMHPRNPQQVCCVVCMCVYLCVCLFVHVRACVCVLTWALLCMFVCVCECTFMLINCIFVRAGKCSTPCLPTHLLYACVLMYAHVAAVKQLFVGTVSLN